MIVEFLGIPGSGKSTMNQLLREKIESYGYATTTFEDALTKYCQKYKKLSSIVKNVPAKYHIFIFRTLYKIWVGTKLQNEYFQNSDTEMELRVNCLLKEVKKNYPDEHKKRKRWLEYKIRQYELFKETTKELNTVALCDEGIASSIGNLFVFGSKRVNQKQVETFLRDWSLPDILITVKAENKLCLKRLEKRGFPELLRNKSIATISSGLENQSLLEKKIINEANRRGISVYYIINEYDTISQLLCSNGWKYIVKALTSANSQE